MRAPTARWAGCGEGLAVGRGWLWGGGVWGGEYFSHTKLVLNYFNYVNRFYNLLL